MATVQRFNVEKVSYGKALYLAYSYDLGRMFWSPEAEDAFEYDALDEADADALAWGGDVLPFDRFASRAEVALMPIVHGANLSIAAE